MTIRNEKSFLLNLTLAILLLMKNETTFVTKFVSIQYNQNWNQIFDRYQLQIVLFLHL
jgi:hypothetical protein